MIKTSNPMSFDPVRKAVVYARVSSKEQDKEGFSIPAQLKLLKEYAAANDLVVAPLTRWPLASIPTEAA